MATLKEKLHKNIPTIGSWITIGDPSVAEIMARAGFDWLTVDLEHSAITLREARDLIRVIELSGVIPLVRVGANDPLIIKRVMDAGAHGVIVPMVNTREDAMRAVASVKYPPKGTRGVGLGRAQGYGFTFPKYKKWLDKESVVIVQIEHIDAIKNLEKILSVPGVDGSMIGPYDLSGSLGHPGESERKDVQDAISRYEAICKKMKKPMGFHVVQPDVEKAKKYLAKGYTFLSLSFDALFLGLHARSVLGELKSKRTPQNPPAGGSRGRLRTRN